MNALILAMLAGGGAGLLAIPHCALMCGPLAAFACRRSQEGSNVAPRFLLHQTGRLVAYVLLGAIVGALGSRIVSLLPVRYVSAILSWWFALVLGLAAVRAWRATTQRKALTVSIRQKNSLFSNVFVRIARHPLLVGTATALLPCGALYSALLLAAGTVSPISGGVLMAAFAIASGPGLGAAVWVSRNARVALGANTMKIFAVALLIGAIAMIARPIPVLLRGEPRCPACAVRELAR